MLPMTDVTSKGLGRVTWHGLTLCPRIRFHCIRHTAICSVLKFPATIYYSSIWHEVKNTLFRINAFVPVTITFVSCVLSTRIIFYFLFSCLCLQRLIICVSWRQPKNKNCSQGIGCFEEETPLKTYPETFNFDISRSNQPGNLYCACKCI